LIASDRPKKGRDADIEYGICVGLVAEWVRLHVGAPGDDAHARTKLLSTSSREISILAQVAFIKHAPRNGSWRARGRSRPR